MSARSPSQDSLLTPSHEFVDNCPEESSINRFWSTIFGRDYGSIPVDALDDGQTKIVVFYFGASWCPPCQNFCVTLKHWYAGQRARKRRVYAIFVSLDKNQADAEAYQKKLEPVPSLPWSNVDTLKTLRNLFPNKSGGIPFVTITDQDGRVLTPDGVQLIYSDVKYDQFKHTYTLGGLFEVLDRMTLQPQLHTGWYLQEAPIAGARGRLRPICGDEFSELVLEAFPFEQAKGHQKKVEWEKPDLAEGRELPRIIISWIQPNQEHDEKAGEFRKKEKSYLAICTQYGRNSDQAKRGKEVKDTALRNYFMTPKYVQVSQTTEGYSFLTPRGMCQYFFSQEYPIPDEEAIEKEEESEKEEAVKGKGKEKEKEEEYDEDEEEYDEDEEEYEEVRRAAGGRRARVNPRTEQEMTEQDIIELFHQMNFFSLAPRPPPTLRNTFDYYDEM